MSAMPGVVVTGLGFVTCIGLSKEAVSDSLRHLRHGIRPYPPFQRPDYQVKVAGIVGGFDVDSRDPEDWKLPADMPKLRLEQLRSLAPHCAYAIYSTTKAIADAGLSPEMVSSERTGMYTASSGSTANLYAYMDKLLKNGPRRCPPQGIVSSIAGTLNFNLVSFFKILGSSTGFVSACASSGHALGHAVDEIVLGRQDAMIVVGAEDCNLETILPFDCIRALSNNPDPDTASRPFDKRRDGFVGTGGAVTMVIENEEKARARGARVYAKIAGWGQASDGYHSMMPHPQGAGIARAMKNALAAAQAAPSDIDYLNAHATSTQAGDAAELKAIRHVFGSGARVAVSSTKALTGHALSLSSIMENAFTVLAMNEGYQPGSAHIGEPDDETAGINVIRESLASPMRLAMSNSSGFGGANVSVIFQHD
ncbi:MAG TPA: beta-ketoacyl-[acyl-carrier-protein] synthase family protein [Opitutales bacterium]|nr:beta-ketoacyl-[acyl-carrier-protein] synthase family protein [Opitutales bacterium]